jgi:hypothetical protein
MVLLEGYWGLLVMVAMDVHQWLTAMLQGAVAV